MSALNNEIIFDADFIRDVKRLPIAVQKKLSELLEILKRDSFHPLLQSKPLGVPLKSFFSFRITRDYRVGFMVPTPHTVLLLAIDHRSKIYQRLRRKSSDPLDSKF